ncbi:MAG TPA: hypothetical protein VJZ71_11495 [Phycisphaerae bacterium]|nr:hypothetical protein [Phycisphaerae bacterium]
MAESKAEEIKKLLDEIDKWNPEEICSRKALGTFNFATHLDTVKSIQKLANYYLALGSLESIPEVVLQKTLVYLQTAKGNVGQLQEFDLANNPTEAPNRHANINNKVGQRLRDDEQQLLNHWPVLFAFSAEAAARTKTSSALANELEGATRARLEVENILKESRTLSSERGAERHAIVFDSEANKHSWIAIAWMSSGVIAGGIAVYASLMLANPDSLLIRHLWPISKLRDSTATTSAPTGEPQAIGASRVAHMLVSKIVILSVLYLSVFWALRNHRAHRHLAVVNRHRANALSTFKTFVEGSDKQEIRDAVLLEATRCVFGQAVSGYLGPEENTPSPPLIDSMRSVIQK